MAEIPENNIEKKTKGRQKVSMVRMEKTTNRHVTFSKRRMGLFKKASELCILCGAQVAVIVFSPGGKAFAFGHPSVDVVINRYLGDDSYTSHANYKACSSKIREDPSVLHLRIDFNNDRIGLARKQGQGFQEARKGREKDFSWITPIDITEPEVLKKMLKSLAQISKDAYNKHHECFGGEGKKGVLTRSVPAQGQNTTATQFGGHPHHQWAMVQTGDDRSQMMKMLSSPAGGIGDSSLTMGANGMYINSFNTNFNANANVYARPSMPNPVGLGYSTPSFISSFLGENNPMKSGQYGEHPPLPSFNPMEGNQFGGHFPPVEGGQLGGLLPSMNPMGIGQFSEHLPFPSMNPVEGGQYSGHLPSTLMNPMECGQSSGYIPLPPMNGMGSNEFVGHSPSSPMNGMHGSQFGGPLSLTPMNGMVSGQFGGHPSVPPMTPMEGSQFGGYPPMPPMNPMEGNQFGRHPSTPPINPMNGGQIGGCSLRPPMNPMEGDQFGGPIPPMNPMEGCESRGHLTIPPMNPMEGDAFVGHPLIPPTNPMEGGQFMGHSSIPPINSMEVGCFRRHSIQPMNPMEGGPLGGHYSIPPMNPMEDNQFGRHPPIPPMNPMEDNQFGGHPSIPPMNPMEGGQFGGHPSIPPMNPMECGQFTRQPPTTNLEDIDPMPNNFQAFAPMPMRGSGTNTPFDYQSSFGFDNNNFN